MYNLPEWLQMFNISFNVKISPWKPREGKTGVLKVYLRVLKQIILFWSNSHDFLL